MKNYFDENGNYINTENLSLAEIYLRASTEGYKKGYADAQLEQIRDSQEPVNIKKTADDIYKKLLGGGV